MSSRERWIVYPLLFLTLGIVMRDKVWPQSHFQAIGVTAENVDAYREISARTIRCSRLEVGQVQCRELSVGAGKGNDAIRLGVAADGDGLLQLAGKNGRPVVILGADESGETGMIELLDANSQPQVQLYSTSSGGKVKVVADPPAPSVTLGHTGPECGVFAESPELGYRMLLTLPWQTPSREPVEQGPAQETP